MDTIFAILFFLFLIVLVVGLFKPQLIMFWSKNPKRIKVFGWWALISFILIMVPALLDTEKSRISEAKDEINQGLYSDAILKLKTIPEQSEFYYEADSLLNYAEEQIVLEKEIAEAERLEAEENERIAKEEAEKLTKEESRNQKIEQLKKEINSINNGVDFSTYRGTVQSVQMELVLFGAWAQLIEEALEYEDSEIKKLGNTLKTKVQNLQEKEFPNLRKAYKKAIYKDLWMEDIETTILGNRYTTIQFTGSVFANNKSKQEAQNLISEIAHMLRFKRVNYKWYKHDDEYTYYTLDTPKDRELVKL